MKIYAHRGASHDFPEMSRAAYIGAVEQDADGFECDLRLTLDGVLICWHDKDLRRLAGSSRVVSTTTLAQLRGESEILTFEELLDIAITHKKNLALETKHPVPTRGAVERQLLEILRSRSEEIAESGIEIAIMSFSWRAIARIRKSGFTAVYLIAHRWQRFIAIGGAAGPGILLLRGDRTLGSKLRKRNRELFVWTVNTVEDLAIAYQAGATVVMSDRPGEMKAALPQLRAPH